MPDYEFKIKGRQCSDITLDAAVFGTLNDLLNQPAITVQEHGLVEKADN